MVHDLRQALRSLARTPGLAAVIVVSLALGTGANAAVYSAVDALLFRAPAHVADSAALVDIYTSQINGATFGYSSYADFLSISASVAGLDGVAALDDRDEASIASGTAISIARVAAVSDGFWSVLGMTPYLGAWPDRGPHGESSAAVISFHSWIALGSDPRAIGRAVRIGDREYVLAAVAPARFRGLQLDRVYDAWVPFDPAIVGSGRGNRRLALVGRLAHGADLNHAQEGLTALASDLARRYPETNLGTVHTPDEPRRMTMRPYSRLHPTVRSQTKVLGAVLVGATALLLLSACVNAGSLLLSRGLARRRDLTIRTALGADRRRLIRQLLIESVLLAMAGAAAGVLVASWTAGTIPALFAPEHASLVDTRVERPVILAALAIGALSGLLFGLAPAVVATRSLSPQELRGDPSGVGGPHGGARLRMIIVAAQLALSTIFLAGSVQLSTAVDAALFIDRSRAVGAVSIASIESYDPGFRDAADRRLRQMPGVRIWGWAATPPLSRPARRNFVVRRGALDEPVEFDVNFVTRDYFAALSIPLIDGRFFTRTDERGGLDVVVVNEALAQRFFTDRAVGHTLLGADGHEIDIVGVVRTRSYRALEGAPRPMVYYPMSGATASGFHAVIRARSGVPPIEPAVSDILRQAGEARKLTVSTFDAHVSRALAADRLIVTLVAACGILALVLAAAGVSGVIADLVRRRTREIGLRLALGAGPIRIVRVVVGAGLVPAFAGVVAGVSGSALLVRAGRSIAYEVPPMDAGTVVWIVAGLSAVVVAAVIPPAWRALGINPLIALRQ